MKTYRIISKAKRAVNCFSLFTLIFASCIKESSELQRDNDSKQIRFDASIVSQSRASTDAAFKTTWEDGDKIGLFVVRYALGDVGTLATSGNYMHNVALTYTKQTNTWSSEIPIYFPTGGDRLDFYAYYPYDAAVTNPTNIVFNISTDQSATTSGQPNYNRSDVMLSNSTKNLGSTTTSVSLAFLHALAMVELKVHKSYVAPGGLTANLQGCITAASGNLSSGTITASGVAQSVKMFHLEHDDVNYLTYRALVPAQSIAAGSRLFLIASGSNGIYRSSALSAASTLTAGKAESYAMNQRVYKIGDLYPSATDPIGVVFWLNKPSNGTSEHGKIASLDEPIKNYLNWGTIGIVTGANSNADGPTNIRKIKAFDLSFNNYPAVRWCSEKSEGGKKWYLPAKDELNIIKDQKNNLNKILLDAGKTEFSNDLYWSSTEIDGDKVSFINFGNNETERDKYKNSSNRVRAISTF